MKKRNIGLLGILLAAIVGISGCSTNGRPASTNDFISTSAYAPASILSFEGGELDQENKTINMIVKRTITRVSLSSKVVVSEGCTWKLYRGDDELPTRVATTQNGELVDGDNPFFIVVTSNDGLEQNTYELNIYRSFLITISYVFKNKVVDTEEAPTGFERVLKTTVNITGYSLDRWKYEGKTVDRITPWGDLSVEAEAHPKCYTISLNPNGGTVSPTSVVVTYDASYEFPVPRKAGYIFLDWSGMPLTGIWKKEGNRTLYANWQVEEYRINYVLDGGTNNPDNPTTYTVEMAFSLGDPTKTGYTFLGWTDAQGNPAKTITKGNTGDITLYANWNEGDEYSVTLDPNGGTDCPSEITVQFDHQYELPTPSRIGYALTGWYDGKEKIPGEGIWTTPSGRTLTARWEKVVYTITYDLDGGFNNSKNPSSYTVDDEFALLSPTKPGHRFLGWETEDGASITGVSKGTIGDLKIKATWERGEDATLIVRKDTITKVSEEDPYDNYERFFYVNTESGEPFNFELRHAEFAAANLDSFAHMDGNGSGLYFSTPIPSITDVTIVVEGDRPDIRASFDETPQAFESDIHVESGVTFFPPEGKGENRYLDFWFFGGSDIYITSIIVHYSF